jgi:hypothetical protein
MPVTRRPRPLTIVLLALAATAASVIVAGPTGAPAARAQDAPTPSAVPLLADFDGDHRADVFWYGPGGNPDHHWFGRADKQFGGVAATVLGTYSPITGDFDGDGRADIFWYGPGGANDSLWFGRTGHAFAGKNVTVNGTYEPLTGDFDGDHRTDILWYGRGGAPDSLWYGRADRGFTSKAVSFAGDAQPLIADFDGDRRADILWYGPGSVGDALWYGRAERGFTSMAFTVGRVYQPLVRDFDGDGRADVFWYGPGGAADVLYFGRAARGFAGKPITVNGTYQAFAGDFDGDHRGDVFWYAPGSAGDVLWYGRADRAFSGKGTTVNVSYRPMVGDVNGDGTSDVFWYAPGPTDDKLWFGTTGRSFSSRPTTIDLDYPRADPLVQQRMIDAYTPFGFIAHANGGIDGRTYTNSQEAFERNYARGFRVFETDFVRLRDGTVFAAHDGLEASYGLDKLFKDATWADLAGHKFGGTYTAMRSQEVIELLRTHPDAYVILDTKYDHFEIFKTFVAQTGGGHALMDRIIPHIQGQADLDQYRTVWPLRNFMVALYRTQYLGRFDDPEVLSFVKNNRAPGVMMWYKDRLATLTLVQNSKESRRFSPEFARALQAGGAVAEVHSIRDPALVARYEAVDVGIYSDEPFGTESALDSLRQATIDPVFRPGTIPA